MGKKKRGRSSTGKKTQAQLSSPVTENSSRKELVSQIKPPEPFNFQEPSSWTAWIRRYKMFHCAFGLSAESEGEQISMLLYCMGQEADELLTSLGMTDDKRKSFDSIVNKFEEHFITNNNLFHRRLLFFERDQEPGEKIDSYLNSLKELSEKCEWSCKNCKNIFKDEMVLLKLITGVSNNNLSKRLKDQGIMTLTMGVDTIRLLEIMEEGSINLFDDSNKHTLPIVKKENKKEPGNQKGDLIRSSSTCNSNVPLQLPNKHRKYESPVHLRRKSVFQEEKGSMRSSFSSGIDTGDECELSANRVCDNTGQRLTRDNCWGVHSKQTHSASTSYEYQNYTSNTFLEEKNDIDFPPLPQPSEEEGAWEYPPDRKTAPLFSKKSLALQVQRGLDNELGLFDINDPSDEEEFFEKEYLKHLRENDIDLYLDYIYYNGYDLGEEIPEVKKSPKVEAIPNEPKDFGNYHFSVSGHQSRKSLRNQCQQKLKDLKKYRY